MSAPEFVPPPPSVAWLAVVCTDRGAHKRTRLADVRFNASGHWYATECGGQPDHPDWIRSWEVLYPEDKPEEWLYEFTCGRCGRNPRIGREKWGMIVAAMGPTSWQPGVSERDLDLSLLPF